MSRLHALDSFRGLAIILVILSHVFYIYDVSYAGLFGVGRYGVVLFYLVSGFTISYVLDFKEICLQGVLKFYVRRFFRVAPLFYVLLFLIYFLGGEYSLSSLFFMGYLDEKMFNRVLHVEWSIYVEVFFYILAPFLFFLKRGFWLFLLFSVLVSLSWRYYFFSDFFSDSLIKEILFFNPLNHLYVFLLGGGVYRVVNSKYNNFSLGVVFQAFVFVLCLVFCFKIILEDTFFIVADYLFSILFLLVIYVKFVHLDFLRFYWLEKIGLISYSLYLLHYIVMNYLARFYLFEYRLFDVILGLIVLFVLAFVSYRCVERLGVNIGARCIK